MNLEPRIESYLSLAEAKSRYTDSLATVDALIDKPTWDVCVWLRGHWV